MWSISGDIFAYYWSWDRYGSNFYKKMINIIAESFYKASSESKISGKLVIVIRPKDTKDFCVNLYDIKDSLIYSSL